MNDHITVFQNSMELEILKDNYVTTNTFLGATLVGNTFVLDSGNASILYIFVINMKIAKKV